MAKLLDIVKPGVVTGEDVQKIFAYAKANNFAIPAVNCVGSDSVNAVLETAARVKAPVIIQFSNGGAAFYAGKGIKPTSGARPDVLGAIAGESGMEGKLVGAIDMFDSYTFVEVPREYASEVIEAMKHAKIKGKNVNVEPANRK